MDKYIALVSYRDNDGQVVRKEAKGTYMECILHLEDFTDYKVISAEISRLIG